MVMKRKRSTTRSSQRKKARVSRITRRPRFDASTTVLRTKWCENWAFGTVSTINFWRYYNPAITGTAGFNNFSEFAAIFDQYKVHWIKFEFVPRFDNVAASDSAATMTQSVPYMVICKDPQSTLTPTGVYSAGTLNTLMENSRCYRKLLTKQVSVYYKPAVQIPTNVGAGVMYKYSPWLRTDDTSVPLRGFHAYIVNSNNLSSTAPDLNLDVYVTMKVSFKNLK